MQRHFILFLLLFFLTVAVSAQTNLVPLSAENASQIELISQIGQGELGNIVWSPLGNIFALPTNDAVLIYSTHDFTTPIDSLAMDGAVVFSPDGRFLASDSGDIWDFEENRLRGKYIDWPPYLSEFYGPQVVFDPTSHYIFATFGYDILVWNVYGVGPQEPFRGDFAEVQISPNGEFLLGRNFLDYDLSEYYIWSLPERELIRRFTAEGRYKASIILSDNQTLVAVEEDNIQWFNLETGEQIFSYSSILEDPDDIIMSKDTSVLYILGMQQDGIAITELHLDENGFAEEESIIYEQLGIPNWGLGPDLGTLSLSNDGKYLSVQTQLQGFALINLETQQREYHFLDHMEYIRSVKISEDNHYLAVGNGRANLHIWNLETGQVETALWGDVENTEGVIFAGDDFYLVQMDYDGQVLGLWDIREKTLLAQLEINPQNLNSFTFSAESLKALAITDAGLVTIWQVNLEEASIQEIARFNTTCFDNIRDSAISGDGSKVIVSAADCTSLIDLSSQETISLQMSDAERLTMNHDGSIALYVHDGRDTPCLYNLDSQERACAPYLLDWLDGIWGVAINPTNELMACIFRFGGVFVVDSQGNELVELDGEGSAIAFSPDNTMLITGTNYGYVNLYGVQSP